MPVLEPKMISEAALLMAQLPRRAMRTWHEKDAPSIVAASAVTRKRRYPIVGALQ